jgi:hypothetical protein
MLLPALIAALALIPAPLALLFRNNFSCELYGTKNPLSGVDRGFFCLDVLLWEQCRPF